MQRFFEIIGSKLSLRTPHNSPTCSIGVGVSGQAEIYGLSGLSFVTHVQVQLDATCLGDHRRLPAPGSNPTSIGIAGTSRVVADDF